MESSPLSARSLTSGNTEARDAQNPPEVGASASDTNQAEQAEIVYNIPMPAGVRVTNDDIAYYKRSGRYPPREISADIKFHIAVGRIKYTEPNNDLGIEISPLRERIPAKGLDTLAKLISAIDWPVLGRSLGLGGRWNFDVSRILVYVHFTLSADPFSTTDTVRVDARGFEEWLATEVAGGRAPFYEIDLVYPNPGI